MLGNRSVRFGARREARPKLQAAFCARRSLAAGFANAIPRAWMSVRHFCKRLFVLSDRRRQLAQAGFYIQVRAAEIANGVPRGQGVPSIPAAVPTTLISPHNFFIAHARSAVLHGNGNDESARFRSLARPSRKDHFR